MAIRRLNYTGRQRIRRGDVLIRVHNADHGTLSFDARINLRGYHLPADAPVWVEAYRQTTWMRFRFGRVGAMHAEDPPELREFSSPDGVLFRVKVTSPEPPRAKLLAEADRIHPRLADEQEDRRKSLLPVAPGDLGDQVFRLDFENEPQLVVNTRVGDWHAVVADPLFVSLVLPGILREVLSRILFRDHPGEVETDGDWQSQWLRFAMCLPGVAEEFPKESADETHKYDWIEEAVDAFCRGNSMMDRFRKHWQGEQV